MLHLGIDIGSKTVKLVVQDDEGTLLHSSYERHLSNVKETVSYTLKNAQVYFPDEPMTVGVTGSAGMQLALELDLPFTQEVIACREALARFIPDADVAIEIGGEDSKILFLTGGEELRMNSTCAGGTGGFIDTIAGMLDANAEKLNYYAHGCRTIHPIASRCAVFAQSDVRPLINEGVSKEDIAGSVMDAVAVQCIAGLACGRHIEGVVALLGGPLHFLSSLRERFQARLGLPASNFRVPIEGHLFVAQGAAIASEDGPVATIGELRERAAAMTWDKDADLTRLPPLFATKEDYEEFSKRHGRDRAPRADLQSYEGRVFLGVDSGSEAIKFALIGEDGQILRTYYKRSAGNVIDAAQEMLVDLWKKMPRYVDGSPTCTLAHATVTGYGEGFLKAAYAFDSGEVETVAHVKAATQLVPDVDFVFDIGGQDMKCLFVRNGNIDDVALNEACSSGCGALLSGMAWSMNVRFDRFLESALFAPRPVDLGTRCTVFMTSRVRHAQKEGATLGDISAGLAYSVIRNALYKVLKMKDLSRLGKTAMVQGGTFMNDAVLRAFEILSGREVVRPDIAPYMGAYGAALLARERAKRGDVSSLLPRERIESLTFHQKTLTCPHCPNACSLIRTVFEDEGMTRTFTVGNRCERGAESEEKASAAHGRPANLFEVRYHRLFSYEPRPLEDAPRGEIGVMRALDMYDLYPFWFTFLDHLGFRVVLSNQDGDAFGGKAIETIPSESLCYPAKRAHGHLYDLIERGVKTVFAPRVASVGGTASACPVLSGYPFVLESNVDAVRAAGVAFVSPSLNALFAGAAPAGGLAERLRQAFAEAGWEIPHGEVQVALEVAAAEQASFRAFMQKAGSKALAKLDETGGRGIVCVGRPYHNDPAIHHTIPDLLRSYGYAVFTEDSVMGLASDEGEDPSAASSVSAGASCGAAPASWEYPERVIQAARIVARQPHLEMVELYSFGCGLDAVTVDRARDELEAGGKALTALKIDEMVDLASTRIRIRSMMAAQQSRNTGKRQKGSDA